MIRKSARPRRDCVRDAPNRAGFSSPTTQITPRRETASLLPPQHGHFLDIIKTPTICNTGEHWFAAASTTSRSLPSTPSHVQHDLGVSTSQRGALEPHMFCQREVQQEGGDQSWSNMLAQEYRGPQRTVLKDSSMLHQLTESNQRQQKRLKRCTA